MLAIDLYCGLGGWAEGLLAEGWSVIGFDIERRPYPAQLVLQDVSTIHGAQFRNAQLIVASPPCQAYSYRAMPWKASEGAAAARQHAVRRLLPHPARGERGGGPLHPDGGRKRERGAEA